MRAAPAARNQADGMAGDRARRIPIVARALLAGLLLAWLPVAMAVEAGGDARVSPRTGNAWIDARLPDMDAYAARYREAFIDEIVRYHEAPRALVEEALADESMTPGDVYFACSLAQASGRPCRAVLEAWRSDAAGGWQGVAERLGVAPAAAIYRRIRGDIAESYVRWARPLDAGASPGG